MPKLSLDICCTDANSKSPGTLSGDLQDGLLPHAIDILNRSFQNGKIQFVSLKGKRGSHAPDSLIQYRVAETNKYGKGGIAKIDALDFSTSYFVGQATINIPGHDSVEIEIKPDLAPAIRNHLLSYACGVYLPQQLASDANPNRGDNAWLLLLMWRCAFERAIRQGSIPRSYIHEEKNLRFFRGRLDVVRQIQVNLTDQSRFYCQYDPMSMDITINRVIRYVCKLITNAGNIDKSAFRSLADHDNILASFGVDNSPVSPEKIDRISYHRMNIMYRPLMQLSKAIIRKFGASNFQSNIETMSYFVDWTEVWENYLLKIMQKRLPEYTFVSPNDNAENSLLLDCGRSIRPDFLVYNKQGELIAVMDAKYKNYNQIGATESAEAISREDLYQMTTYLYHYSSGEKLPGIFLARGNKNNAIASEYKSNRGKIILINMGINDVKDVEGLESQEREFAENLKSALSWR